MAKLLLKITQQCAGKDVYIISIQRATSTERLFELLLFIDGLRRSLCHEKYGHYAILRLRPAKTGKLNLANQFRRD